MDRQHEVALDYGGTFVVNLARRSLAGRQFGVNDICVYKYVYEYIYIYIYIMYIYIYVYT